MLPFCWFALWLQSIAVEAVISRLHNREFQYLFYSWGIGVLTLFTFRKEAHNLYWAPREAAMWWGI